MRNAYDAGRQIGEAFAFIDFFYAMEALARLPYPLFPEYAPDGQREYKRGEVVRVGHEKYLLENWGRIDPNVPPPMNPLCKLFRDGGRYPWVQKEYCLKGYEREYNGAWYRVISERVDSGTTPPNDYQNWERVG